MLLLGIFTLSGLLQIQKRIQNLLENGFGKLKKKKKRVSPSPLGFWPNSQADPLPPFPLRT
jgi:hypothetical protein